MKKLIIATGLLMATSAYAQTEVLTGVTRGKDYGVVYSLPKTQIELEIKANKVSYTPGGARPLPYIPLILQYPPEYNPSS